MFSNLLAAVTVATAVARVSAQDPAWGYDVSNDCAGTQLVPCHHRVFQVISNDPSTACDDWRKLCLTPSEFGPNRKFASCEVMQPSTEYTNIQATCSERKTVPSGKDIWIDWGSAVAVQDAKFVPVEPLSASPTSCSDKAKGDWCKTTPVATKYVISADESNGNNGTTTSNNGTNTNNNGTTPSHSVPVVPGADPEWGYDVSNMCPAGSDPCHKKLYQLPYGKQAQPACDRFNDLCKYTPTPQPNTMYFGCRNTSPSERFANLEAFCSQRKTLPNGAYIYIDWTSAIAVQDAMFVPAEPLSANTSCPDRLMGPWCKGKPVGTKYVITADNYNATNPAHNGPVTNGVPAQNNATMNWGQSNDTTHYEIGKKLDDQCPNDPIPCRHLMYMSTLPGATKDSLCNDWSATCGSIKSDMRGHMDSNCWESYADERVRDNKPYVIVSGTCTETVKDANTGAVTYFTYTGITGNTLQDQGKMMRITKKRKCADSNRVAGGFCKKLWSGTKIHQLRG